VKLCQRAHASCGACCGLYNRPDADRAAVQAELARHTRGLARTPRTPEAFRDAARRLEADAPAAIFPSIRVCPLAGFLDAAETRVGCLAHPKATGGVDLRACGVYDVETCESFLCPAHAAMTEREAALVEATTDFHLYGLVVPDAPFVRAALDGLAAEAGGPIELTEAHDGAVAATLRALFALKEELEPGSDGLFTPFHHAPVPDHPGASASEKILAALGADDRSGNDAERLGVEVERRLRAAAQALRAARGRCPK
jgi:hypothetical protein